MHPPEPIYPCYLPVLGEFNRMTPHEGPSTSLPELTSRFESAAEVCGKRSTAGGRGLASDGTHTMTASGEKVFMHGIRGT